MEVLIVANGESNGGVKGFSPIVLIIVIIAIFLIMIGLAIFFFVVKGKKDGTLIEETELNDPVTENNREPIPDYHL